MKKLSLFLMLLVVVACTPAAPPSPTVVPPVATTAATPTPALVATEIVIEQPTAPVRETATIANTSTPIPPEAVPSFTPSPSPEVVVPADVTPTPAIDPAIIPPASIIIAEPGVASQVTSPITVRGVSDSTFEQSLIVQLLSADGTELAFTATQIEGAMGQRGEYEAMLNFDVTEPTPGFIIVSSQSAMDGKTERLSSVGVTLLPEGSTPTINPAESNLERIVITSPAIGDVVSGGVLLVEGYGRATFENTLVVELSDANGTVLDQVAVTVNAPLGQYGRFSVEIPYQVTEETPARVAVRDVSPAYGGDAHVSSLIVRLTP